MANTPPLAEALRRAELSKDQAHEIAKTESVAPGSTGPLLEIARNSRFHVLKDEARKLRIETQAGPGLAELQHASRFFHHRVTDKGTVRFEGELEPHIGMPIASRLESEARRLARKARNAEPFDRYMADALPELLSGTGKGAGKTEMVVLVSYEIPERGWTHVEDGEFCKIPGVGPIDPQVARRIAGDAFLSGMFFDGRDLRQMKRWGRSMPAAIKTSLNLGEPPNSAASDASTAATGSGSNGITRSPMRREAPSRPRTPSRDAGGAIAGRRRRITRQEGFAGVVRLPNWEASRRSRSPTPRRDPWG